MEEMTTVSEVISHLRTQGYTADFNLGKSFLSTETLQLLHDEFVIDKVYRFEGNSDPADEATVYAISSARHGLKGILVNGAGIYTDELTDEMLRSLQIPKA